MYKTILKLVILTFILINNGICEDFASLSNQEKTNIIRNNINADDTQLNQGNFFISISAGYGKVDVSSNFDKSYSNVGALDDSGAIYQVDIGYNYNKNIFYTLSLQSQELELLYLDNIYSSINYKISKNIFSTSFGFLVGYSNLRWDNAPIKDTVKKDISQGKLMYGCQTSFESKMDRENSLFFSLQYLNLNHKININNNSAYIKHNKQQNILLGVKHEIY